MAESEMRERSTTYEVWVKIPNMSIKANYGLTKKEACQFRDKKLAEPEVLDVWINRVTVERVA